MNSRSRVWLILFSTLTVAIAACGYSHGSFRNDGFVHSKRGYSVCYANKTSKQLIDKSWELDNFTYDEIERTFSVKAGGPYVGVRLSDEDGGIDRSKALLFDLKLMHKRSRAVIFVQTFAASRRTAGRSLSALFTNYVRSLRYSRYPNANMFGLGDGRKRYLTEAKDVRKGRLGREGAISATVHISPVGRPQYQLRLRTVLLTSAASDEPNVMVIGYYNRASDFPSHLPTFESFLGNVQLTTRSCK